MTLWDSLIQLVQREAQHLDQPVLLPDHNVPAPADLTSLAGGDGYFQVWVVQMFLKNDRAWFKSWYPVVQSLTQMRFGDLQNPLEIAQVAGPGHLRNVDLEHLDRVVQMDLPLTPLLPFSGGTVQIEAGLVAMKSSDLLRRFLDVMGAFAKLLVVPQVSTVLNVADAVSSGVNQLLGIGDSQMVLGLNRTFESAGGGGHNDLRPLYMVVFNAPTGTYPPEKLWIKESKLLCGPSLALAQEVTGVDYMVLRVETRRYRDDWDSLSSISGPFNEAIEALSKGSPQAEAEADALIKTAAYGALTSPDLAARDRSQVARAIWKRYEEYKISLFGGQRSLEEPVLPTLSDVALAAREMDDSPLTVDELFSEGPV
jgi:hypothetical protein